MKLLRIVPLMLLLAAGASYADTTKGSGSGSGATVSDADVKRFLAFFDKLADTIVADKASCPKMGTDVNALIDANQDLLALAAKAKADGKTLSPDAQKHMQDTAGKMIPALMGCKDDASVKSALGRLQLGPKH